MRRRNHSLQSSACIHSVFVVVLTRGFEMEWRVLSAAMTAITLVTIPTVSSALSTVTGSKLLLNHRHSTSRTVLIVLFHNNDLILVLHRAASVRMLTASRVILRSKTLQLDLNLMLRVTPVSCSAAAPAGQHNITSSTS